MSRDFVEVNSALCRLRPTPELEATPQGKKTTEAIPQEVTREVEHLLRLIFRERRHQGRLDLEAVGMAIRSALHQAGAAALRELLKYDPPEPEQRTHPEARQ